MINKKKLLVVGSWNTDMVVTTNHFPLPGETVLGGKFFMNPGGKGANQAVAAARLEANVTFITKVGKDLFGASAVRGLKKDGIDVQYIIETAHHPSGVALISVNEKGENSIIVAPGANMALHPRDITDKALTDADIVLMQLEIPMDTVEFVARKAKALNKKVVLNPAPAAPLSDELLQGLYLITPNETETQIITGILPDRKENIQRAADYFLQKGVENVVITMGSKGVCLINAKHLEHIPAPKVSAVDTTAAGDVFNGALVTALTEGMLWIPACHFACQAAAISVTKKGAQSSAPYRKEIK